MPPECSWNPQLVNNKKEGTVEVYDEDGLMIASLEYKNDLLNGVCKFFRNGMIAAEIPYCDDVASGCGYDIDEYGERRMCYFENGEWKVELKKSERKEGYYDEIDVKSGEILSICKMNENHEKQGEGFIFKNGLIDKVVVYENGNEKYCLKEFSEKIMIEYDENGNKVYEGGYLNSIEKEYPREGQGKEFYDEVMIYEGEWKDGKRNGRGVSLRNKRDYYDGMWKDNLPEGEGTMYRNGKMICKGDKWVRGRLQMENGEWMEYEGEVEERVITIGWNDVIKLVVKGKNVVYEDWSNDDNLICIGGNLDRGEIVLSKWNDEIADYERSEESIEYGQTIDLSDEGDRWEGGCLNGKPIGNGVMFDGNNRIVYKGLVYDGKKVCYGEEYYADSGTVEYRGYYLNGLRHGWGCLYDKEGGVMYEGNWYFGKNDNLSLRVPDECEDDGMISNVLKELIIGEDCYKNMKELIIYDFNELERLKIGDYCFKNVERFEIQKCDRLRELIIGDGDWNKGCFYKVKSFELSSLIDLI